MTGMPLSPRMPPSSRSQVPSNRQNDHQPNYGNCSNIYPSRIKTPYSLLKKGGMGLGGIESGIDVAFLLN
jgi:hypothetical protein